jgi:ABC-2 type transport system ATP-binding protein
VLAKVGFVPQLPPPLKMPVGQLIGFAAALCGSDPAAHRENWRCASASTSRRCAASPSSSSPAAEAEDPHRHRAGPRCEVLIMDEPAANLDPEARKIFFELLAERQHDATMLISSHRLNEVATLVNRVVELDMGRVVLDDRVADDVSLSGRARLPHPRQARRAGLRQGARRLGFPRPPPTASSLEGEVAGPDRLRFLGMTSRYVALIADLFAGRGGKSQSAQETPRI